jgi:sugar lactone lactonase YvrE
MRLRTMLQYVLFLIGTSLYWLITSNSAFAQDLYVGDIESGKIEVYSPSGNHVGTFASGLIGLEGLAFDGSGNLYAANNNKITKYSPTGVGSVFATSNLLAPEGLAFDSSGNLYVSSFSFGTIEKISPSGADLGVFASGLPNPMGIAFDNNGNLYVVNSTNTGTITKITPGGIASIFTSSGLQNPTDIAINANGNLFVTATTQSNLDIGYIEEYTSSGTDEGAFAYTGGGSYPRGLAFDSSDNLYEANSK